ncbi:MAG: aminotransferase class I/II-fold pyridoxal phosphate-dependent enzyme [bacterium]|nr:aminotransferase class I/II-fold pyridoxal phosphate-dependent enzyme [bacterium]
MSEPVHYIRGDTAVNIAASIEQAVRGDRMHSGDKLPPVRRLAEHLGVSPATVAAAYQSLQARGLVISQGRRGTRISHRPLARPQPRVLLPPETRNLADGNPDPALLPDMGPVLVGIDASPRLYGESHCDDGLLKLVRRDLAKDGVSRGQIAFVNGAMDGIERLLAECLQPGDRVAVEDPTFGNTMDLVISRGLVLVPVGMDDEGPLPEELHRACEQQVQAFIVTPRAQNPTGATISAKRARRLRAVLRDYPDVLVIEDDHLGLVTTAELNGLHQGHPRWAYLRSFNKALNPDLRLAAVTGDDDTMTRVLDRLFVGERWVSHLLQRTVCALMSDAGVRRQLRRAAKTYDRRREALVEALRANGFAVTSPSGINVWVPVMVETCTVQALAAAGWAVIAGERFRIASGPAIRISAATLDPHDAKQLAADLAAAVGRSTRTATA